MGLSHWLSCKPASQERPQKSWRGWQTTGAETSWLRGRSRGDLGPRRPGGNQSLHLSPAEPNHVVVRGGAGRGWGRGGISVQRRGNSHRPHLLQPMQRCYINCLSLRSPWRKTKRKGRGEAQTWASTPETEANWEVTELSWVLFTFILRKWNLRGKVSFCYWKMKDVILVHIAFVDSRL